MQTLMGIDAKSETFDSCSFNEEEDGPELVAAELTLHNTFQNAMKARKQVEDSGRLEIDAADAEVKSS